MKRLVAVLLATGFVAYATVALATPGSGSVATILSSGSLQVDLPYNTGLPIGNGLTWVGKQYIPDQLPEFLMMLRRNGVEDLGQWLQAHPAVEAKFGFAPVAILKTPVVVTQQIRYPPGSFSGWHSHPGYLTATVTSGQVVRYDANCKSETFSTGQSFYETGTQTFIVKNTSSDDALLTATYVVPVGTPTTGLRIDKPQPTACTQ